MIVAGASRHAKEVVQILKENNINNILLFDDVSSIRDSHFDDFELIKSLSDLKTKENFVLALGGSHNRKLVYDKLILSGLRPCSVIASTAIIGDFKTSIGEGINIMHHVFISDAVQIGEGCLINAMASVHHDTVLGEFVEVSPGASILGGAVVEKFSSIGSGARILPNIQVGTNCIIGVGAIVTHDLPNDVVAVGVPAKIIKKNA